MTGLQKTPTSDPNSIKSSNYVYQEIQTIVGLTLLKSPCQPHPINSPSVLHWHEGFEL